jgi:hypothetical protein
MAAQLMAAAASNPALMIVVADAMKSNPAMAGPLGQALAAQNNPQVTANFMAAAVDAGALTSTITSLQASIAATNPSLVAAATALMPSAQVTLLASVKAANTVNAQTAVNIPPIQPSPNGSGN